MENRIKLSRAEAMLVDMAYSEAQIAHKAAEQLMQSRLSAITDAYGIADGTEISFQREDNNIVISYDDTRPSLKVVNGADATTYNDTEEEEDGS